MQPQNTPNDNSTNPANAPFPGVPSNPPQGNINPTPPPAPMSFNGSIPTVVNPGATPDDVLAAQAMVTQPLANQTTVSRGRRKIKRVMLPLMLLTILLMGGGAAAYFGYVVPNKPENLWAAALQNTGRGYDQLVAYQQQHKNDKGADISGKYTLDGPTKSDGNLSANWYDGTGVAKFDIGLAATRATVEARILKSTSKNPDIYVNIAGIKGLGSMMGSPSTEQLITKINNQWIAIDHTLLDNLEKQALSDSNAANNNLTPEDLTLISQKIGESLHDHAFTADSSRSAFVIKQKIGKETRDGRSVYHYKATVNKQQLKALVTSLRDKLGETKIKQLAGEDTFNQFFNLSEMQQEIDQIDTNKAVAEVWIDTKTKVFHAVRIAATDKPSDYVEFGTPYSGGDIIPFVVKLASESGSGSIKLNFNPKAAKTNLVVDFKADNNVTFNLSLDTTVRNSAVAVEKPATSKQLSEVLGVDLMKLLQSYTSGQPIPITPAPTPTPTRPTTSRNLLVQ